jgi:toxin ParE1/3/4
MGRKIIWTPEALADLESLRDYIARDSEEIAAAFVERLLRSIDRLLDFPMIGPEIRERTKLPYRHLVVPPYRIVYRVGKDEAAVHLIAIAHARRDLKQILRGRN